MEKKKLLLVAISVGAFLVITIGAAILVFEKNEVVPPDTRISYAVPGNGADVIVPPLYNTPPAALPVPVQQGQGGDTAALDPVGLVRNPDDIPGLAPVPEGTFRQEDNDFYVTGKPEETVITVPKPSSAAVPEAPPSGRAAPAQRPVPAAVQTPVPPAPVQPKPAPAPTPAAAKVYDDYWVQTGAFSTISRAENVKETLALRGINSIIENREVGDQTFFRVRVGPYTSENEAGYWLQLIKSMDGFEDSQIRQTQSRR